MELEHIGDNVHILSVKAGLKALFSYKTLVAVSADGVLYLSNKYAPGVGTDRTVTTSKHISQQCRNWSYKGVKVLDEDILAEILMGG